MCKRLTRRPDLAVLTPACARSCDATWPPFTLACPGLHEELRGHHGYGRLDLGSRNREWAGLQQEVNGDSQHNRGEAGTRGVFLLREQSNMFTVTHKRTSLFAYVVHYRQSTTDTQEMI